MPLPPIVPREVLFGNPERMSVRLSPDGCKIGYIAPLDGVLNVWVRSVDSDDDHPVTHDAHRGIRFFLWAYDDKHLIYLQDKDGDENWHVYAVNLENQQVCDLTPYDGIQAQPLSLEPEIPDFMLIALNKEDPHLHDVYKVNINTGLGELIVKNPGDVIGWDTDWHLQIRGASAQREDGGTDLRIYNPENETWTNLLSAPFGETVYVFGITPDERNVYVSSTLDSNTSRVLAVDMTTGKQKTLAERTDVDFDGDHVIHPTRHHLEAVSFTKARQEWMFLDKEFESSFKEAAKLDNGEVNVISRDLSDQLWIIAFASDVAPVKYYLFDRKTGDGRYLFSQNTKLENVTLAPMKPVEIPTRDGLAMICYLSLPVGMEPRGLPMVLNVHGGPWARDTWGLRPEPQWLANRGYAVLQVNYRGSTGFGKAFVNAANKEWGGKMHDDLVDAVNWAVTQGIADPQKIGILGWSYGGYATFVGMTFTPDVFAVGVAGVGISNLISWYFTLPPYWEPFREQINLRVGNANTEEEFMRSRSPLFKVDQIKNPLMIAQGANDPRVPQAESDQIVEALRASGREVEYLLFDDEGHGFARPENRLTFYAAAEKFLAKVLGGRTEE